MKKQQKTLWALLAVVLCVALLAAVPFAVGATEDNTYIAADGTSVAIPTDATTVSSSDTAWSEGWYVVDSNVEITSVRVELTGDVHLVLKDGCSLTMTGDIASNYEGTNKLTVYGQSGNTGLIDINVSGSYNVMAIYVENIEINGGTVNTTVNALASTANVFGIYSDDLTINGGTVNVTATAVGADKSAYGIYSDSVSINGGTVNVTSTNENGVACGIYGATTISGGTVTLNAAGKDSENTALFTGTMAVNDEGTLVLPSTMYKSQVLALGIEGTGGIKYGNAHIDPAGNCITHNWTANIRQKDTTCHYTEACTICYTNNEDTVAACEYDDNCDTDCNICKIVRTIEHIYGENGFCTVCRYSDTPAEDSDGDGLLEIDSAGKLWWFTHQVNGGNNNLNAELTADIDLADTCGANIGNWLPIGNSYSGHFNGQGFTVSNLYMTGNDQYIGLFGYVSGATIENVSLTGSISSTFSFVANFETYEYYEGAAGGVVAYLDGGTIRNCHVNMTVSGGYNTGGICGRMDSNGVIENCTSNGAVTNPENSDASNQSLGGIAGCISSGTVRSCTNYAAFSSTNGAYIGGIAAFNYGTIENCVNYSNLISHDGVYDALGGIAECNGGTIRNCGNYGNISGYDVGGIVCQNIGAVENCYNIGTVSGTSGNFVGPISGLNQSDGTTTNNYYLSDEATDDGGRTAEQFASGQVAYELNGSTTTDDSVWKQTLGTDDYPALTGELVYYITPKMCDSTELEPIYSNASEIIYHDDTDDDSFCNLCGWLIISEKIFPDANFRTYITEEFDTDKDGLLSNDEIAAVTEIKADGKGIESLSGVEYFTNLQYLYVFNNSLTTLDVSGNKALTVLHCGQNQLTTLDVSQNTELVELSCYGNLFTSLDVSANGKLAVLNCGNNPNLTSLKVSAAIVEIDVAYTALKNLDLSACSQLEDINFFNTNLTSLELPAHFVANFSASGSFYQPSVWCDIDQQLMYFDMRDFVPDVSRVTGISENARLIGNYLYVQEGATQVYYGYDTGAAEGSVLLSVIIYINNPRTHSFDENGYCAECGLQANIIVAVNGVRYATSSFADALALAEEGSAANPAVITLFADVTVDEAVTLTGGAQILDLNGHTLTVTATNDTPFTLIAGTFTIRDSSTAQTGTIYHGVRGNEERTVIALTDSATLVLESGTLDFSNVTAAISVEDGSIMQQRGGKITTPILLNNGRYELDDGAIETTYPYAFIFDTNGGSSYHIEINGGTISVNDSWGNYGLFDIPDYGGDEILTITGGIFKNTSGNPFMICVCDDYANVTVTGGTFEQGLVYANRYPIDETFDVSDFLAPGYAFYDADGNLVVLTDDQTEIAGYVKVACGHYTEYIELIPNNDGTHEKYCAFCENVIESGIACSGTTTDDCDKGYKCSCGGYFGTKEHSFGDYLSDSEGHWHECADCGATDAKTEHSGTDDGFCDVCSKLVVDALISQVSLTLDGDIGINFYWILSENVINNSSAYFLVTLPNGDTEQIPVTSDLISAPSGDTSGYTYYKVTGRVAAKEMAEDIKVELIVDNASLASAQCSVRGYAERAFSFASENPGSLDEELITMMKAMLNYGAASQILFDHNKDDLANSILSDDDKIVADANSEQLDDVTVNANLTGIKNEDFSCILETKTTIRHYFSITEGTVDDYYFAVEGREVTPVQITRNGKTMYYVDITDIAAKDMDYVYTFMIVDKNNNASYVYASVYSYMNAVIKNKDNTELVSTELVNTVNAMYAYGFAAYSYFG